MTISDPLRAFSENLPSGWQLLSFEAMLAEPVRNGIYKTKEFHGRGARVVNMGELFGFDFISSQEMKRVELTADEEKKNGLIDGDLLFARRSFVLEGAGKCSLVVSPPDTLTFESSIIRARPKRSVAEPRFLFYLFTSPLGRAIMASIATRTAVSGIRGSDLVQVGLPLPPLPVQRRIAGILSAYDELMENSQRRIRLLEAMARALYREWFVHFRFPGHEKLSSPRGRRVEGPSHQHAMRPSPPHTEQPGTDGTRRWRLGNCFAGHMGRCPMLVSHGPLALGPASPQHRRQIQNLRRTRDLLLARLLSGQVELKTEAA